MGAISYDFSCARLLFLFPTFKLLRKPSLFKSSVFFTWLRLSYPQWRPELLEALTHLKQVYLAEDRETHKDLQKWKLSKCYYLHTLNLYTLLEFAIPVIQDYGIAIKLNSLHLFMTCFEKMLLLFIMLRSRGSNMYSRSMLLFYGQLKYWMANKLPIVRVLQYNLTAISEESGCLSCD